MDIRNEKKTDRFVCENRKKIPESLFTDFEDGNTRDLRLVFKDNEGKSMGKNSWIQFDTVKQEIYAL